MSLAALPPPQPILSKIGGGGERARTDDPQLAKLVLSLLSYTPQKAFGFTYSPWLLANGR